MAFALKTVVFTVLVPGGVAGVVPFLLVHGRIRMAPYGLAAAGLVLIVLGAACYLRCAFDFAFTGRGTPAPIDPPRTLVAKGPYRFVRNPMYAGVLTVLLGEAVALGSISLFCYAVVVGLLFHWFVVLYEEPVLRAKFGHGYEEYLASVPRWLPRYTQK
jgi:protein-S-isoprenylcysteine O-methyltransferase Ste14